MTSSFEKLLLFIDRLEEQKIPHALQCARPDAIMVFVHAPGQKWEIEFLEDGTVEIEIFESNGEIFSDADDSKLKELWELFSDPRDALSALTE